MADQQKLDFVLHQFPALLRKLHASDKGNWGLMNAQQMIEHFIIAVKNASGKFRHEIVSPPEHIEKMQAFMRSDKPFRENTKNRLMGDPLPVHYPSIEAAIEKLEIELNYFTELFRNNPSLTTVNPIFGELNYGDNVQLLYKHAQHHLRQFGLI